MTNIVTDVYTEDTLKSLNKPQVIDLFLKMQEHTNRTKLTVEIRNLNAKFKRLEPDVDIVKKVNNALVKRVALLECECCWRKVQNSPSSYDLFFGSCC